jgi:hypothetical protein
VIRFGNWFDLLTEEEVCFPCNLLQNKQESLCRSTSDAGESSRDGHTSGHTPGHTSGVKSPRLHRTQSLISQNATLRSPSFR